MLRDLTTQTNRRQGIAAMLAMVGLAAPTIASAKKSKSKRLRQPCQNDGQCKKVNGRCAIPSNCTLTVNACCRDRGQQCWNDCDCCAIGTDGQYQFCRSGMCGR